MKALRTTLLLISLFFLGIACGSADKRPAGILSKEEMVHVLTETYMAEEKIKKLNIPPDYGKKVFNRLQLKLYERTGVGDTVLNRSIDYYLNRPEELKLIYTALVDSLNLLEQRVSVKEK